MQQQYIYEYAEAVQQDPSSPGQYSCTTLSNPLTRHVLVAESGPEPAGHDAPQLPPDEALMQYGGLPGHTIAPPQAAKTDGAVGKQGALQEGGEGSGGGCR